MIQVNFHTYHASLQWTGNRGSGTLDYQSYERSYKIDFAAGKHLKGSSDPRFRGDAAKINPEEMLLASLSACHMLWYLHLCADAGILVMDYHDHAEGALHLDPSGSGKFVSVKLKPLVAIQSHGIKPDISMAKAQELHEEAHQKCFIANSCNFPISIDPSIQLIGSV